MFACFQQLPSLFPTRHPSGIYGSSLMYGTLTCTCWWWSILHAHRNPRRAQKSVCSKHDVLVVVKARSAARSTRALLCRVSSTKHLQVHLYCTSVKRSCQYEAKTVVDSLLSVFTLGTRAKTAVCLWLQNRKLIRPMARPVIDHLTSYIATPDVSMRCLQFRDLTHLGLQDGVQKYIPRGVEGNNQAHLSIAGLRQHHYSLSFSPSACHVSSKRNKF